MFFVSKTRSQPQRPLSGRYVDQGEGISSSDSDTSGEDLETGFSKTKKPQNASLRTRFTGYARGRRKSLVDWKHAQPRSTWAKIFSGTLGILVIITLTALLIFFNIDLRRQIPRNDIQRIVAAWGASGSPTQAQAHYPTDFSRDVIPIPCHSHNDYWRKVPLYDALAAGCTGVEADVWLTDNDLLVGHSKGSLTSARSLASLYINPLIAILKHQNPPLTFQTSTTSPEQNTTTTSASFINGVFETNPATSLVLLIDIKTNGVATFPVILQQLEPLRSQGFLTYFNGSAIIPGPITVVGTGNTPFDLLISNTTYRDIFFDAPLDQLWGDNGIVPTNNSVLYTAENSYYASVDFDKAIGKPWHGSLAPLQVDTILGQARAASAKGLKARYWNTPAWPAGVRDHIWDVLEREGVGMLNVDDLTAASQRNWVVYD